MPEPADFEATEAALPGLEPDAPRDSALKVAARRSIRALESAGYLDDRHAVVCQLILDLADVISAASKRGQAAAAGMSAAQLLAAFSLLLPEATEGGGSDGWDELVADLRRSAAASRDPAQPSSTE